MNSQAVIRTSGFGSLLTKLASLEQVVSLRLTLNIQCLGYMVINSIMFRPFDRDKTQHVTFRSKFRTILAEILDFDWIYIVRFFFFFTEMFDLGTKRKTEMATRLVTVGRGEISLVATCCCCQPLCASLSGSQFQRWWNKKALTTLSLSRQSRKFCLRKMKRHFPLFKWKGEMPTLTLSFVF